MKSPLLPLRNNPDTAALLDRGGRPTLRELLGGLQYDPASGALRLNAERVTLQLAEADRILRRELIAALGEDEARIFLLRRGFRMGQNDAAFVARSWPALDRGDVFTAGTRLHMFSGIVRVETVYNDFDFARGRFSAEFLWHNSVEAECEGARPAARPVCWQQLGYASGYASHFFGALVVYKETACAAQGHRACTVVGRLATGWGDDDPDVILFRGRIAAAAPAPRPAPRPVGIAPGPADAPLLAPVLRHLERAARLPLPCLIAGDGACGQDIAALHLARLAAQGEAPLRLSASAGPAGLRAAVAQMRKPRRKDQPARLLVEGIEALPPETQADLARDLADDDAALRGALVATAAVPLADLARHLVPALWARLAPLAVEMPGLAARARDLPQIAALRLGWLAARLGLNRPEVAPGAFDALAPPAAGLDGLDAVLTACLVAGAPVDASLVAREQARVAPPALPPGDAGMGWIAAQIAAGGFSLDAHEARVRELALTQAGGNLSAAARLLGISRAQLAYREKG